MKVESLKRNIKRKKGFLDKVNIRDESEPSWLGSAHELFFPQLEIENWPKRS